MKKLVFLCVLLAAVGILSAELAWPEPVTVVNYENVRYSGHSLQTSDGCHLLVWWQNDNAVPGYKLGFYDQQYQPLWDTPLAIPTPIGSYGLVETSDQAFVILCARSGLRLLKISRTGEFLWGPQGTLVSSLWMDTIASLAADHNGGVYVSWSGDGYEGERCAIQHLDASGAPTMSPNYVIIEDSNSWYSDLMILPDDSVLVCWSVRYMVRVQRMNYSGQFMWPQPLSVASTNNIPIGKFCALADSSFALCVDHDSSVDVQRYDFSGAALWPQPVTAISANWINGLKLRAVPGPDNSIFVTAETNNTEYLQKIDAAGVAQYGAGIDLTTGIGYLDGISQAIPDAAGGCVVVACVYDNPRDVIAIQVSAAGDMVVYEITNTSNDKRIPTAHGYGNSIGIEWYEHETWRRGIKVQVLDQQFQPQLAANGMELVYGGSGKVKDVMTSARGDGSAVIWDQATLSSSNWDLYLQIHTSDGQPLFADGGFKVNRPESFRNGQSLVCCNDYLTMVVWGEQLGEVISRRYQIFDAAGNILLPEGGLQIGTSAQNVGWVHVSTYMGYWYMIWSSSHTTIWGQKIGGTVPLWGDGIQITQPHPTITGYMRNIKLEWPWLTWSLDITPMLACIDLDGAVVSGFPQWGLNMPIQYGSASLFGHVFTVYEDKLHVVLGFYDDIGPDWTSYYYTHTMINRHGDFVLPFERLSLNHNYHIYIRDGMLCIGDYYHQYRVRRYYHEQLFDIQTMTIPGFNNVNWGVLGVNCLSNGDLLMIARGYINNSPASWHMFITPQWEIVLPDEHMVFTGGTVPPSVSLLGDRAWIAQSGGRDNGFNYAAAVLLQGVTLAGTSNPDPDPQVPAMPCLESCFPNPFKPSTSITFSLPEAGPATISVFDLRGRKIATLLDSDLWAGKHSIIWAGKNAAGDDVASGVYILLLESGGKQHTRKVTLLK